MKIKTSVSISDKIIKEIEKNIGKSGNKSIFIEDAVVYYIKKIDNEKKNKQDLDIINENYKELNDEAESILSYQDIE